MMSPGLSLVSLPSGTELITSASLRLPFSLTAVGRGIVGFCRTTHDGLVTIDTNWSGKLFDLARARLASGCTQPWLQHAAIDIESVDVVDGGGDSVAPLFIPAWSFELRMAGTRIAAAGGTKVIRFASDGVSRPVPSELLPRFRGSLAGQGACSATASSRVRLHMCDAVDIEAIPEAALEVKLLVRATVIPG
jgi:hypothetical protein